MRIKEFSTCSDKIEYLAKQHNVPVERVRLHIFKKRFTLNSKQKLQLKFVLIALQRKLLQDYRSDLDKRPLFKQGMTKLEDLEIGDVLTGLHYILAINTFRYY